MTVDELKTVRNNLLEEMDSLREFCDLDNDNVLDVNAEYIKRMGQFVSIKSALKCEHLQLQGDMEKLFATILHKLMYNSDISYTITEAKQFALADDQYSSCVMRENLLKGCINICDEGLNLLKSLGWALKLHAEMTINGLEDVTF